MKNEKTKNQLTDALAELSSQNSALKKSVTGRISAELAAQEATFSAESIVETVREPLLVLDANLKILSANHSFYRTFKATVDDTIGKFVYDLENKQWDIPQLRELLEEILPEKKAFDDFEVNHYFKGIGHKTMLLNAREIYRKDVDAKMVILAIEDITEIRLAESVIRTIREPLIVLDHNLRVVTASRSFYDFFKVTPKETVGRLIYDLGNKQWDIPTLRERLGTILPEKISFDNYEVEQDFTKIGRRTMLLNARQITGAFGKERVILLAFEDITERKIQERLLEESEERYRRLFENASDGIVLLEKGEGKITQANPATKKMLGYTDKDSIGRSLQDIGITLDRGNFQSTLEHLNRIGILKFDDIPAISKSGQLIYTDIYLVDRARLVQCNIRDITERKQAAEALRKSEKELKIKANNLEEVNAALNVLLKRVEEGRIELEEKILSNIRERVLPYIDRLKKTQLSDHQNSYLVVIEANLDNIASSFLYHLKMKYLNLTHREVQVSALVKEGKSSKEIAELLNIALKTVVFHRNSLRKKLGLKNHKANLRTHLLNLP